MKKDQKGITVGKEENFSEWYTQVIQKAELIEYSPVSGCMILRPYAYELWERIQEFVNTKIKAKGVKNAYFPLFIPEKLLTKEEEHVEGFSPEVAWVTHAGNSELQEKLAVRPTSETIMYDAYSKWIRSHRDLPLLINQWCNVVRWEFKNPVPFLRTREFLWQEGHPVFATQKESEDHNREIILDVYKATFEELLAVPVLPGRKSEKEKFAGADFTESVETFLPNGKAIQGATSHCLGQNFSKAFDIKFSDEEGKVQYAWQNSWGITTRSIGTMIMMHGDDKGLVLPPSIAPTQVMIIPILFDDSKQEVLKGANTLLSSLEHIRVDIDPREEYTPGWKYSQAELKGIPLRIELGPRDLKNKELVIVRRDTGEKQIVKIKDTERAITSLLQKIQDDLFLKANQSIEENTVTVKDKKEFSKAIQDKKLVRAPWCSTKTCEDTIKDETEGAKSLVTPFEKEKVSGNCAFCEDKAKQIMYFAKSY